MRLYGQSKSLLTSAATFQKDFKEIFDGVGQTIRDSLDWKHKMCIRDSFIRLLARRGLVMDKALCISRRFHSRGGCLARAHRKGLDAGFDAGGGGCDGGTAGLVQYPGVPAWQSHRIEHRSRRYR